MRDPPEHVVSLLLAEHQQAYEMYRYTEELGERRVNFFLTLVTAVLAALVVAGASTAAYPLLGGLLLVGLLTLIRLARRDEHSSAQLRAVATIREYFSRHDEVACSYLDFHRWSPARSRVREFSWRSPVGHGGLAETMLVLNACILGAIAGLLLVDLGAAPGVAVVPAVAAAAAMWLLQFRALNDFHRGSEEKRAGLVTPLPLPGAASPDREP